MTLDVRDEIRFDRPEAWGMKFAAATTVFTALDSGAGLEPGRIVVGFEASSIPSLSENDRRIGFLGTKVEDIDRARAFGRLRAALGLPHRLTLEIGFVPPVELDGLRPTYFAAAISRPIVERGSLRVAARLGAQIGRLEGDITCSNDDVDSGNGPPGNPFGCESASEDELETTTAGLELAVSLSAGTSGGFEPYASIGVNRLDARFRVDARYSGIEDHTRLDTSGWIWSLSLGAARPIRDHWRLAGELFYSPLEIRRPGRSSSNEPVLNLRVALRRHLR